MRLASLTLPFLAVAALAAACTKTNPDFCGSDPCPPDAPPAIDGMTGCTANPGNQAACDQRRRRHQLLLHYPNLR